MSIANEITRIKNNIASAYTAVNTKGGTLPATQNSNNLATAINSIPSGGGGGGGTVEKKDVNFYDYDGTITNSYTAQEFLALSSMPDNPTHTGLTSQGWNWTLADAQDYVEEYGACNIGQMYVTDDGATRIYIHLEDGRLEPYLGFAVNGTATVDWGDNTTSTVKGTSAYTVISTQHTYASAGDYVIKIIPNESATISFAGTGYTTQILWNNKSGSETSNYAYNNAIQKIELGDKIIRLGQRAFGSCYSLSSVTMPSGLTNLLSPTFEKCYSLVSATIPSGATNVSFYNCYSLANAAIPNSATSAVFTDCYSLTSVAIPSGVTYFSGSFARCYSLSNLIIPNTATTISGICTYCYSLSSINIPSGITNITNSTFGYCYSLSSINIPSSVTNIAANAFQNCCSMAYYDFTSHTTIPTLANKSAFNGIPSDCKIVVPDSLYEEWVAATNWNNYASKIIKESEWND